MPQLTTKHNGEPVFSLVMDGKISLRVSCWTQLSLSQVTPHCLRKTPLLATTTFSCPVCHPWRQTGTRRQRLFKGPQSHQPGDPRGRKGSVVQRDGDLADSNATPPLVSVTSPKHTICRREEAALHPGYGNLGLKHWPQGNPGGPTTGEHTHLLTKAHLHPQRRAAKLAEANIK